MFFMVRLVCKQKPRGWCGPAKQRSANAQAAQAHGAKSYLASIADGRRHSLGSSRNLPPPREVRRLREECNECPRRRQGVILFLWFYAKRGTQETKRRSSELNWNETLLINRAKGCCSSVNCRGGGTGNVWTWWMEAIHRTNYILAKLARIWNCFWVLTLLVDPADKLIKQQRKKKNTKTTSASWFCSFSETHETLVPVTSRIVLTSLFPTNSSHRD